MSGPNAVQRFNRQLLRIPLVPLMIFEWLWDNQVETRTWKIARKPIRDVFGDIEVPPYGELLFGCGLAAFAIPFGLVKRLFQHVITPVYNWGFAGFRCLMFGVDEND